IAAGSREESLAGARLASPGRPKARLRKQGRPYENVATNQNANLVSEPLRRRSWQQIGRAREIEDARQARRERESDTSVIPPPRNIIAREPS
ncbi:MAG: hypothetical protein WBL99_05755, partial [Candidatus Acidiferrales bacterium]